MARSPANLSAQRGRPSALACRECRQKHLRCDGLTPICSRCSANQLSCTYIPSQRGKRSRPGCTKAQSKSLPDRYGFPASCTPRHVGDTSTSASVATRSSTSSITASGPGDLTSNINLNPFATCREPRIDVQGSSTLPSNNYDLYASRDFRDEEHLTNLFYSHFHPVHPFLQPRSRHDSQLCPPHLKLAIQAVGSHFAPATSSTELIESLETMLLETAEISLEMIQSLLLLAIILHAQSESDEAARVLGRAVEMAIEIGINRDNSTMSQGVQDPLLEESICRTWWELFIIDGYFAALRRCKTFKCNLVELTARLPRDEDVYADGKPVPPAVNIVHFDQRYFDNDNVRFSSACYRIGAVRILSRAVHVLEIGGGHAADDIQAVDNAIAAWKFHLPPEKAGIIDAFGRVDQMILQAHSLINYASILLHFPRSELLLKLPQTTSIACSDLLQSTPTSAQHAVKAVSASKELSDLAALPVSKHSPLFICTLVFGCLVQLSACSAHSHDCIVQHRERVALMTGLLKHLGRTWSLSADVLLHLNRIASAVFNSRCTENLTGSQNTDDGVISTFSWLDIFFPESMDSLNSLANGVWD